jgi:hypothetical protein
VEWGSRGEEWLGVRVSDGSRGWGPSPNLVGRVRLCLGVGLDRYTVEWHECDGDEEDRPSPAVRRGPSGGNGWDGWERRECSEEGMGWLRNTEGRRRRSGLGCCVEKERERVAESDRDRDADRGRMTAQREEVRPSAIGSKREDREVGRAEDERSQSRSTPARR